MCMAKNNLLDIIIPVYNTEKYLHQCLSSIVCQWIDDVHIYIVNDASTDNSLNIIREFENLCNITVVSKQHNEGLSSARNFGMYISNGEYIMFLDSDDWLQEGCLKDIKELLQQKPDIVIGLLEGVDTENSNRIYNDPHVENEYSGDILTFILKKELKIAPAQKYIVRREFITNNKLRFENFLHEDQLWSPTLLTLSDNIILFPKHFYKYRLRQHSLSTVFSFQLCIDYCKIIKLLYTRSIEMSMINKKYFLYRRCAYLHDKILRGLNYLNCNEQDKVLKQLNSMESILAEVSSFCEKFTLI